MTTSLSNLSTDWIGSKTIFYNVKTLKISENILDVINQHDFQWDKSGLAAYCDYGYAVYGRTPIKDVLFLLPNQKISIKNNQINIEETRLDEKIFESIQDRTSSDHCIDLLRSKLEVYDSNIEETFIPLSGGFDSRMLLYFFPNKSKIKAYTYGISSPQKESFEVKTAEALANHFHIPWKHIELGNYNLYIDKFYNSFGPSCHSHGMYHHEFYDLIRKDQNKSHHLLSGLIGDAWAGSIKVSDIKSPGDLIHLAHHHQMKADSQFLNFKISSNELYEFFWEREKKRIADPRWRVVLSMRTKMMLLKYLITVPMEYSYKVYAPFIESDLALNMLKLPDHLRDNRNWQKDFLASKSLLKILGPDANMTNNLNTQALKKNAIPPLDVSALKEIFSEDYLKWINRNLLTTSGSNIKEFLDRKIKRQRVRKLIKNLGFDDVHLKAYFAYLTLYPLQQIIKSRDMATKQ